MRLPTLAGAPERDIELVPLISPEAEHHDPQMDAPASASVPEDARASTLWTSRAALLNHALVLAEPAARTLAIARLLAGAQAIGRQQSPMVPWAQALTLMTVVVPALSASSSIAQQAWANQTRKHYDQTFLRAEFNHPATWALGRGRDVENNARAARTHLFVGRLCWQPTDLVAAGAQTSLKASELVANMALFGSSLGVDVVYALIVGAALVHLWGRHMMPHREALDDATVKSEATLRQVRMDVVDNVLLGNQLNFKFFGKRLKQARDDDDATRLASARQSGIIALELFAAASLPMLGVVVRRLMRPAAPEQLFDELAPLVLQMGNLFAATGQLAQLSSAIWDSLLPAQRQFLKTLELGRLRPSIDFDRYVQGDKITVHTRGQHQTLTQAWPALVQDCIEQRSGHVILRGANGSGKSVALLQLKSLLPVHRTLLLPADHGDLDFGPHTGSTGERDMWSLSRVLQEGPHTLLLDEPMAHLDPVNRAHFAAQLGQFAQDAPGRGGRMIIEVSHQDAEEASNDG